MPIPPNINNAYKVSPSRNNNINFNYIWDEGNQYWSPKGESSLSYHAVVGYAADFIHKFGSNPDVSNSISRIAPETVWDGSTEYVFPPDSGTGIQIKSSQTIDNQEFVVQGLDENFLQQNWTGNLNGQTEVNIDGTWSRVFRAFNNDSTYISGNINIHASGDDSTSYAQALVGNDQTMMAIYTIPANFTGYLTEYHMSASNPGSASSIDYTVQIKTREYGKIFRVQEVTSVGTTHNVGQILPFPNFLKPKTDIMVCAVDANGGGGTLNADFDVALHQGAGKTI
jgi:hypothetical protein